MLRAVAGGLTQAAADGRYAVSNTVTNVSPTSGQTVAFLNASNDQVLWLTPAADLAALTVTLPTDASSRLGQRVNVACNRNITTFAITAPGGGSVLNAITSFSQNDCFAFIKVAANTWILLQ